MSLIKRGRGNRTEDARQPVVCDKVLLPARWCGNTFVKDEKLFSRALHFVVYAREFLSLNEPSSARAAYRLKGNVQSDKNVRKEENGK